MAIGTGAATPKFYLDDPISRIEDSQDASEVKERDIDLVVDTLENSVARPGDSTPNVRAQNVNTVDEVPDSNWFTNRLGTRAITVEELLKGPDTVSGPAPGNWTVIAAKNDGVTPGFTVRDSAGQIWFIKFDPPGHRAMATGNRGGRHEAVLGAWLLRAGGASRHVASRPARDRRVRENYTAKWQRAPVQAIGYSSAARGSASRRGRLVSGDREQGARGQAGRRISFLRHALQRSQRRDPARASPRAACATARSPRG